MIALMSVMVYIVGEVLLSNSLATNPIVQKLIDGRVYIALKTPFTHLWPDREVVFQETDTDSVVDPEIPYGEDPSEYIPLDTDELQRGMQEARSYQGVANWFRVLWKENTGIPRLYLGTRNEPFFAVFEIASFTGVQNGWHSVCLLDYSQIPCSSEKLTSIYIPDGGLSSLAIKTPSLTSGLHALSLILLADTSDDVAGKWWEGDAVMNNPPYMIAADGHTNAPDILFMEPTQTRGTFGLHLRMVDVHTDAYPLGSDSDFLSEISFQSLTSPIAVSPGDRIDFYLHLNNPHEIAIDYAVVAILDRRQVVPLYVNGEEHSPLYVHNKSRSWQMLRAVVVAPDDLGHHNFQILSFPFPYATIESARDLSLDIGVGIAQPGTLIEVEVFP
jgi:hypothetical protein